MSGPYNSSAHERFGSTQSPCRQGPASGRLPAMEYPVLHRCGHEQRHSIYRTFAAEADREVARLGKRICTRCWRDEMQGAKQRISENPEVPPRGDALAALVGTMKQVQWAEKIRAERIASRHGAGHHDSALLETVTEAKWWIDNRGRTDADLLALCSQPASREDRREEKSHAKAGSSSQGRQQ
jgi:hypothetical protein